ncbi:hypothetical protein [Hyalangium gracile]|uniref:hypothetical protein n=1 Tax=Hyalangium gracile TaxID=394092 RepID=UPI001CCC4D96|nr:hypothetical protein [Hyalangium gracile]
MSDFFVAGGWGMYPTLLAGLALLATSILYSRRPERRYVPLMLTLGVFTQLAGSLGFVTGLMVCLRYYASPAGGHDSNVIALGLEESLHNIAFALLLTMISALFASVGAWRLSRQVQPAPSM